MDLHEFKNKYVSEIVREEIDGATVKITVDIDVPVMFQVVFVDEEWVELSWIDKE